MVHVRPGYTASFKACSKDRIAKRDADEYNLLGYFLCDGATEFLVDGDEYYDIAPVWEWYHIPGVTSPASYKSDAEIPVHRGTHMFTYGDFTGAVSDGKYGCAVYDFTFETVARKGYFFFDNEIVMMGSGVGGYVVGEPTSASGTVEVDPIVVTTDPTYIHTTVNQCNLEGTVNAEDGDGVETVISGEQEFDNLRWLSHDGICYYFPKNDSVTVRAGTQSGTWARVNDNATDKTQYNKDVFLTYFNHGSAPFGDTYEYYVLPGRSSIAEGKSALDKIASINSTTVQCVYNVTLDIVEAIFYYKGNIKVDGVYLAVSEPCVVMVTNFKSGEGSKLYVSDPSCSLSTATVSVEDKTFKVSFPYSYVERGQTVSVTL